MWWGFTPAKNLRDRLPNCQTICTVGLRDIRHVLKTLSLQYKSTESVKFYICEQNSMSLARSLLLTCLWLDESLGFDQSAQMWLEIYGNLLLRPCTWHKFASLSSHLVDAVTKNGQFSTGFNFDLLKYKERDQIVELYNKWRNPKGPDVLKIWNEHIRQDLGTRYDSRDGAYDWDYHMCLRESGAKALNFQEYRIFREFGIGFLHDDADPCVPNLSLLPITDIEIGPFFGFGVDSDNKELLDELHGRPKFSSAFVSEWNIRQLLYGLRFQNSVDEKLEPFKDHYVIKKTLTGELRVEWPQNEREIPFKPIEIPENILNWTPLLSRGLLSSPPLWFRSIEADLIVTSVEFAAQPDFVEWLKISKCRPLHIVVEAPRVYRKKGKKDFLTISYGKILDNFKLVSAEPSETYDCTKDDFMYFSIL